MTMMYTCTGHNGEAAMTTAKQNPLSTNKLPPVTPLPDRLGPTDMSTFDHLNFPGLPSALTQFLGHPETTIITSEIGAHLRPAQVYENVLYPDLLIAFNADPQLRKENNGYIISNQGKPPDFVLEIASESTAKNDEETKRTKYEEMGITEYWRFDPCDPKMYYIARLAGDTLVNGHYQPVTIHGNDDEGLWGHSEALGLDLCWEEGRLRFRDPVNGLYLLTHAEEQQARRTAEARAQELEEELRRFRQPEQA